MRKCLLVIVFILTIPHPGWSQIDVIDRANLFEAVLMVGHLFELIGLATQDLASLSSFGTILEVTGQLAVVYEDINAIVDVTESRGLGWRTLAATVPCTPGALRAWNGQASTWMQGSLGEVRNVTGLFRRMTGLVMRLSSILNTIFGSTGGLQSASAHLSLLIGTVDKFATSTLSFQQASIGEQEMAMMNALSTVNCLQPQRLEGWGTITVWTAP